MIFVYTISHNLWLRTYASKVFQKVRSFQVIQNDWLFNWNKTKLIIHKVMDKFLVQ